MNYFLAFLTSRRNPLGPKNLSVTTMESQRHIGFRRPTLGLDYVLVVRVVAIILGGIPISADAIAQNYYAEFTSSQTQIDAPDSYRSLPRHFAHRIDPPDRLPQRIDENIQVSNWYQQDDSIAQATSLDNQATSLATVGSFPQFRGFDHQLVSYEEPAPPTPAAPSAAPSVDTPTTEQESLLDRAALLAHHSGNWIKSTLSRPSGATEGEKAFHSPASLDFKRIFGSLTIVIGGYLILVWLLRLLQPKSGRQLPSDAVEVLGKTPFRPKESLQLVRLGSRLLLLLDSENGVQPLAEVTDPHEVDALLNAVQSPGRRRQAWRPKIAHNIRPNYEV